MDVQPQILVLKSGELEKFRQLLSVFERVFEMDDFKQPDDHHLLQLLESDNFLAVVAIDHETVIGGLTVYVLNQYYAPMPLAYLYDLAVSAPFQRQGIGKQLLQFTIKHCEQSGFQTLFVQADRVDDHAIEFYRSNRPTSEAQVVHFSYSLSQ